MKDTQARRNAPTPLPSLKLGGGAVIPEEQTALDVEALNPKFITACLGGHQGQRNISGETLGTAKYRYLLRMGRLLRQQEAYIGHFSGFLESPAL